MVINPFQSSLYKILEEYFIFSMWDWKPFGVYIYSMFLRKKIIFSMWDLKPFSIYSLCSQEKSYLFNVEFEAFSIYTLYLQEKSYVF
jgi:uncharacterized membrane protein (GlpM family)